MISIADVDARITPVKTRIPFRYGIAEMTAAPHVAVEVRIRDDHGRLTRGWASEHLPPKWFTKDPNTSYSEDLKYLVETVEHAVAEAPGRRAPDAFRLWQALDGSQSRWAESEGVPGLLAGLGTSLVERAMIDAICRAAGVPFYAALRHGVLGFDPAAIHPELAGRSWRDLFPERPASSVGLRHTVALADPLSADEVVDDPADGQPVSLAAVLSAHRVRYLKVKTAGDPLVDRDRLATIFDTCAATSITPRITIDGNESMRDGESLRWWADSLLDDPDVGPLLRSSLIAVEQPVHRDAALSKEFAPVLKRLAARGVAMIVDESDGDVHAVRRAMELGYAGGTYKGCKGVFRGLANGALISHRRRLGQRAILTAEDLSTLPPLTVGQDLVIAATIGLTHLERNGHHFFGGLAPIDPNVDQLACAAHPDLYQIDGAGGARLHIDGGVFSTRSVLDAPFGFSPEVDISGLRRLSLQEARTAV